MTVVTGNRGACQRTREAKDAGALTLMAKKLSDDELGM